MTSVPAPTFGPNGFIIPNTSDVLNGVTADINSAFGGGLNPAPTTPQGQLATSETAVIDEANETFLFYTTQTDPAFATGRMQDAIGRIYFIERLPAQPTVLDVTCFGSSGVVIPVGSLVTDTSGNIYSSTNEVTIGNGGSVSANFANLAMGPIPVPEEDAISIYQAIPGWDSAICLSGVLGNEVESRAAFELRRQQSVAKNSIGSLPSILGAVLGVDGILDAYVTENVLNTNFSVGSVVLVPHSIYVAAVGGLAEDIGQAIWSKKAPGCNYNGNTTVTVQDNNSGYNPPLPSYEVTFEIPEALKILFSITIINSPLVPSNALQLIQSAIINAFSGADGGARARIGSTLLASRFYAPLIALGSWVQIVSLLIGSINNPDVSFTGSITGNVLTVTATSSGALAIGQTISDAGGIIPSGTQIVSFGSGSGGDGTYNLNVAAPISSGPLFALVASTTEVIVEIDQVPVINANDIQVKLV